MLNCLLKKPQVVETNIVHIAICWLGAQLQSKWCFNASGGGGGGGAGGYPKYPKMFGGQTIWPESTKYRLIGWLFDFLSDPKVAFLKPLVHLALGCDSKKVAVHKFCNDLPLAVLHLLWI